LGKGKDEAGREKLEGGRWKLEGGVSDSAIKETQRINFTLIIYRVKIKL
jgi:hypothetical protein